MELIEKYITQACIQLCMKNSVPKLYSVLYSILKNADWEQLMLPVTLRYHFRLLATVLKTIPLYFCHADTYPLSFVETAICFPSFRLNLKFASGLLFFFFLNGLIRSFSIHVNEMSKALDAWFCDCLVCSLFSQLCGIQFTF